MYDPEAAASLRETTNQVWASVPYSLQSAWEVLARGRLSGAARCLLYAVGGVYYGIRGECILFWHGRFMHVAAGMATAVRHRDFGLCRRLCVSYVALRKAEREERRAGQSR